MLPAVNDNDMRLFLIQIKSFYQLSGYLVFFSEMFVAFEFSYFHRNAVLGLWAPEHYDLCTVESCVNLLSALDSRNGVMSMRTSPHLSNDVHIAPHNSAI